MPTRNATRHRPGVYDQARFFQTNSALRVRVASLFCLQLLKLAQYLELLIPSQFGLGTKKRAIEVDSHPTSCLPSHALTSHALPSHALPSHASLSTQSHLTALPAFVCGSPRRAQP